MKIKYNKIYEVVKDEKVICWSDLLIKLDLIPLFKKYQEEHKKQYSIDQILMGKTLLGWIEEILRVRIAKTKDKRVRDLKDQYRLASLNFDALQSMPVEAEQDIDYMELKDL